eukprot:jgi/Pico_ML_1/54411/g4764.t1
MPRTRRTPHTGAVHPDGGSPASLAEELEVLDVDQSGTLSVSEIVESVRMYRESKRQYGIAMKIILALCVFALIQVAAIVGTVWRSW